MPTSNTRREHLDKKCSAALEVAVGSFNEYLREADPEAVITVVAGLIQFQLSLPPEHEEPGAELARIVDRVEKMAERHKEEDDEFNL